MSAQAEETARGYIRKYANKHELTFDEAKEHAICELASLYFKEKENKKDGKEN